MPNPKEHKKSGNQPARSLTSGQAAAHCQVSAQTINDWVRAGRIEAFRTVGGHVRVPLEGFQRFLAENGMPAYQDPVVPEPEAVPPPVAAEELRVLVADDDPEVLDYLADVLRAHPRHFKVETAADGYEALIKTGSFRPALLILDLAMPRIDGVQVCRTLKSVPLTAGIRILGVTGHPDRVHDLMAAGADGCLVKPVRPARLELELARLLALESER